MITNGSSAMGLTGSKTRDAGELSRTCLPDAEQPRRQWEVIAGYRNSIGRDRRAPVSVEQSGLRLVRPLATEAVVAPAAEGSPRMGNVTSALTIAMRWTVTMAAQIAAVAKLVVRHRLSL